MITLHLKYHMSGLASNYICVEKSKQTNKHSHHKYIFSHNQISSSREKNHFLAFYLFPKNIKY